MTLVSVVIPTYNCGRFITESINSILGQTYKNLEVIVIDDSSTDGTDLIVNQLQSVDSRILYYQLKKRQENIALLLNIGINLSKGDVVARQDADDVSMVNRIENQLNLLKENNDVQFVSSKYKVLTKNGQILNGNNAYQYFNKLGVGKTLPPLHGTWMFKKEIIDEVSFYDEHFPYAQDYEFYYRITKKYNKKTIECPEILYCWREHGQNISHYHQNERNKFIMKAIEMYK